MKMLVKKIVLFLFVFATLIACGAEEDACLSLVCMNDGTCVNGACACPDGYEGEDCSVEKAPISMSVVGINITQYPTTDSTGGSWDSTDMSGPDVFFVLHEGTGSNYDPSTSFISSTTNDAIGDTLKADATPPYLVTNLDANWSVDVWDADDNNTKQYMDGVIFMPSDKAAGLPTSFEIAYPKTKVTFFVQWNF